MKNKITLTNSVFKNLSEEIVTGMAEMKQSLHKPLSGIDINEFMPDSDQYLVVDKEFNISLPCFKNSKILILSPLPKALYVFFLLHPEGVGIYRLNEYREELFRLYSLTKGNQKNNQINGHTIENLITISNKRFYENLSLIKRALINAFGRKYAGVFCITKDGQGCYRISADRSKISMELE